MLSARLLCDFGISAENGFPPAGSGEVRGDVRSHHAHPVHHPFAATPPARCTINRAARSRPPFERARDPPSVAYSVAYSLIRLLYFRQRSACPPPLLKASRRLNRLLASGYRTRAQGCSRGCARVAPNPRPLFLRTAVSTRGRGVSRSAHNTPPVERTFTLPHGEGLRVRANQQFKSLLFPTPRFHS